MKQILIVVDMQQDFVDGALGTAEAQAVVPAVVDTIRTFPGQVFATLDTHDAHYMETSEGRHLPIPHCIRGTDGWHLQADVQTALAEKSCIQVEKGTFGSIRLPQLIRQAVGDDVGEILLVGVCTDICVVSNALLLKANFPEWEIKVAQDCCAGVTPAAHQAALTTMAQCQITIV